MNKSMKITISIVASLSTTLVLYWYWTSLKRISTDNAYVETSMYPINSRMMGFVRDVFVEENQIVKKGDLLLKLDDIDTKLEFSFKEAKLKKAGADFERAKKLQQERAISQSDFEMAQAAFVGTTADLEGSKLKLKFTEIVTPVDGIVAKRSAQPGQFVQPGQSLFVVVSNEKSWIRANFKESQIRLIKPGQKVDIEVDAYPDSSWEGVVDYIYPSTVGALSALTPENTTGNFTKVIQRFPVKISFEQKKDFKLKPGMSVVPTVIIK